MNEKPQITETLIDAIRGNNASLKVGDDYIAPNFKAIGREGSCLVADDVMEACLRRAGSLTILGSMLSGDSELKPHPEIMEDLLDTANSLIAVSRELLESYDLTRRDTHE